MYYTTLNLLASTFVLSLLHMKHKLMLRQYEALTLYHIKRNYYLININTSSTTVTHNERTKADQIQSVIFISSFLLF